jgi:hypothetical protein
MGLNIMPDYKKNSVDFIETKIFKEWLKRKKLSWPNKLYEQKNILADFHKELLENKGKIIELE